MRSGVSNIILVDKTDINEKCMKFIKEVNPTCDLVCHSNTILDKINFGILFLKKKPQFIVDCLDYEIELRGWIGYYCKQQKIELICSSMIEGKMDPTRI